jgi:ATP-dependent exoDNAse (exonuclease V) alpha subunit
VVAKRNDRRRDISNGDRGRVTAVDAARCALTIDFGGRAVALDADFLMSATRDGEPTLLHAYAITGHIAQGMTVDHALVLADEGINR